MKRKNWEQFVRDESGVSQFPIDMVIMILMAYGLYLLIVVASTLIMSMFAVASSISYLQAATIDQNLIDPSSGQLLTSELVHSFSGYLPVNNSSTAVVDTPPSKGEATQPGELLVDLNSNNGYDHLTVDYALKLPLSIPDWNGSTWTSISPKPIDLHYSLSFYQEW